jgi:hypothetical protein
MTIGVECIMVGHRVGIPCDKNLMDAEVSSFSEPTSKNHIIRITKKTKN